MAERKKIDQRTRFRVLERCKFRCTYCGVSSKEARLYLDHVMPHSKHGEDSEDNLTASCFSCNIGKHNGVFVEAGEAAVATGARLNAIELRARAPDLKMEKFIKELGSPDDRFVFDWWVRDVCSYLGQAAYIRPEGYAHAGLAQRSMRQIFKECSYPAARDPRRLTREALKVIGKPAPPSMLDRARLVEVADVMRWRVGRTGEIFEATIEGSGLIYDSSSDGVDECNFDRIVTLSIKAARKVKV